MRYVLCNTMTARMGFACICALAFQGAPVLSAFSGIYNSTTIMSRPASCIDTVVRALLCKLCHVLLCAALCLLLIQAADADLALMADASDQLAQQVKPRSHRPRLDKIPSLGSAVQGSSSNSLGAVADVEKQRKAKTWRATALGALRRAERVRTTCLYLLHAFVLDGACCFAIDALLFQHVNLLCLLL